MKCEMEYACGHTTTVDCTMDDRDHMRDLIGRTFCPDCWGRMCASGDFVPVRMSCAERDADYWSCRAKPDSYDSETDTIVVNVHKDLLREKAEIAALKVSSAAIEGMSEVRAAKKAWDDYKAAIRHWQFVDHCGCEKPKEPAVKMAEIESKYPRAAAFLAAEEFTRGVDIDKCAAGRRAMEKILRSEDYAEAIKGMEAEWEPWPSYSKLVEWMKNEKRI